MIAKKKRLNLGGIMKAKNYKSITEILTKKYQCKFYLFMDLEDCMNRIKQKRKDQ
nr:hypothetical protein [uncultured Mediterranean phage uvMED]BAR37560.1 hypothetical protein [uncultured Mediterranean phage uvMED]